MDEMEQSLRMALARVLEHCPRYLCLTGIFSASDGQQMAFKFAVASEEKLRRRLMIPLPEFLKVALPAWTSTFEQHHRVKPAFVMEWVLDESVIQQGVRAVTEEIVKQVVKEAKLHTAPPDDWGDIDYYFCTLKTKANQE